MFPFPLELLTIPHSRTLIERFSQYLFSSIDMLLAFIGRIQIEFETVLCVAFCVCRLSTFNQLLAHLCTQFVSRPAVSIGKEERFSLSQLSELSLERNETVLVSYKVILLAHKSYKHVSEKCILHPTSCKLQTACKIPRDQAQHSARKKGKKREKKIG